MPLTAHAVATCVLHCLHGNEGLAFEIDVALRTQSRANDSPHLPTHEEISYQRSPI